MLHLLNATMVGWWGLMSMVTGGVASAAAPARAINILRICRVPAFSCPDTAHGESNSRDVAVTSSTRDPRADLKNSQSSFTALSSSDTLLSSRFGAKLSGKVAWSISLMGLPPTSGMRECTSSSNGVYVYSTSTPARLNDSTYGDASQSARVGQHSTYLRKVKKNSG
jgi:hypothetical protein